jgi:hypothetical protein
MVEAPSHLTLVVDGGSNTDAQEVSALTAQLRQRLLELDVERVELVRSSDIPIGAKPVDAVTIGALTVTLAPALVQAVVELVKSWLGSRPVRSAKVTIDGDSIELTHASQADQDRLTQAFVDRHAKK